ncbi:hypothetical protein [Planomonospora parontospora]|uniref:hypothetical protein n=1 Tax=Planomonospora parontospora TaxID=58119 RepID=UPI00167111CD|nr:hypothetical protein [Planomonospora parontospora]GGL24258.1 hypothetical protein GCM10014719_27420 [Planomonospora parontospora subsp. antibiotica]GII15104.1 hypothetical protein Ppa05_18300 [Planomonospora parontospora subsp. antibiotica]
MIDLMASLEEGPVCACGATVEEGQTLCRKCHALARWLRRTAKRRKAGGRRGETRRPAGRPQDFAEAGVIWT